MGFTKAGNRKSNLHLLPLKGNLHTEKIPVRVVPAALNSSLRAPAARPDSTPLIDSSSPILQSLRSPSLSRLAIEQCSTDQLTESNHPTVPPTQRLPPRGRCGSYTAD